MPIEERRLRYAQEHELPEPWSGDLERALILFVSSNPSAADPIKPGQRRGETIAPRAFWDDDRLMEYYQLRVNGLQGLPTGIAFPITKGYVKLSEVVTEAAIGTIVAGERLLKVRHEFRAVVRRPDGKTT